MAPNLHTLSVQCDSRTAFRRRVARESLDFDSYTGAHLPTTVAEAKKLRVLKYGVPCSLADVSLFLSSLPDLIDLEITGEVDQSTPHTWTRLPVNLTRFWVPGVTFQTDELETVLSGSPQLRRLGFTCDVDDTVRFDFTTLVILVSHPFFTEQSFAAGTPPTPEEITLNCKGLWNLFSAIGPQLTHLLLMAPHSDMPDPGRIRIPGLGAGTQIQIAFHTFGAPGPGPGAQPGGPNQQQQPRPRPNQNAGAAGAAGGAGNGNGNNPAPAGPFGGIPFPFMLPINVAGGATSPGTPFFDEIVEKCTSLVHLELYGRRYSASLVDSLRLLPLEHLALAVPVDEERLDTVRKLAKALREDSWPDLRMLELCGRGGDWESSERMRIKERCQERGIPYSSTETSRA